MSATDPARRIWRSIKASAMARDCSELDHGTGSHPFTLLLTNDPDHGRTADYRQIFSELNRLGIKVTTAVFCTVTDDGSKLAEHCSPGETHSLADPEYRELMLELQEQGHEIAYHGFSQVSNTRAQFIEGLDIFKDIFGHDPFTYIEHGGNPDKHPLDMCKAETLAVDGAKPDSPHYVEDLLRDRFSCVWARHALLDDDDSAKTKDELFFEEDGILFFRRSRMSRLSRTLPELAQHGGVFPGYTHFGYDGYARSKEFRFENWLGPWLAAATAGLEQILDNCTVRSCTVQELVTTPDQFSIHQLEPEKP